MGFEIENGVLVKYIDEGETRVVIPDEVTSIGGYAFEECTGLKSVAIPDSVKTIGDNAFANCEKLEEVILPDNIEKIAPNAFDGTPWDMKQAKLSE